MTSITRVEEWDTVFALDRAMLFIHAQWSSYSVRCRQNLLTFEADRAEISDLPCPLFEVDIDDDYFIREGHKRLQVSEVLFMGSGELFWLVRGQQVKNQFAAHQLSADDLILETQRAFSLDSQERDA